jgi:hypothetical protein
LLCCLLLEWGPLWAEEGFRRTVKWTQGGFGVLFNGKDLNYRKNIIVLVFCLLYAAFKSVSCHWIVCSCGRKNSKWVLWKFKWMRRSVCVIWWLFYMYVTGCEIFMILSSVKDVSTSVEIASVFRKL